MVYKTIIEDDIDILVAGAGPAEHNFLATLAEASDPAELVARGLSQLSNRRGTPFVKVNCAALPATLIESELFGHERGSFTGATSSYAGAFERADIAQLRRIVHEERETAEGNPMTAEDIGFTARLRAARRRTVDVTGIQ